MHSDQEQEAVEIDINFFWLWMWLFTLGYVKLEWWESILSIMFWPYFIGRQLSTGF